MWKVKTDFPTYLNIRNCTFWNRCRYLLQQALGNILGPHLCRFLPWLLSLKGTKLKLERNNIYINYLPIYRLVLSSILNKKYHSFEQTYVKKTVFISNIYLAVTLMIAMWWWKIYLPHATSFNAIKQRTKQSLKIIMESRIMNWLVLECFYNPCLTFNMGKIECQIRVIQIINWENVSKT